MLAVLAGHKRYTHIAALRGDEVLPELLGMGRIVSEDAVRRAFATIEEEAGAVWLRRHLDYCLEPFLAEAWITNGAGAASSPTTWRAAVWPRASSRCFTIGGTSSFAWSSLTGIWRPSPAGHCFCMPWPHGCGMQDKQQSLWRVRMPKRFPPPRHFALSLFFYASWQEMRSS